MAKSEKSRATIANPPEFGMEVERGFAFLKGKRTQSGHGPAAFSPDYLDAAALVGSDETEAAMLYEKHRCGTATPHEARHMARILSELYKMRGIPVFAGSNV